MTPQAANTNWLLQLPEEQGIEFRRELIEYEARKHMPYITSIEEMGREQGRQEGRQEGWRGGVIATRQGAILDALEIRFGQAPETIRQRIKAIQDETQLRSQLHAAIQADSLESFDRAL